MKETITGRDLVIIINFFANLIILFSYKRNKKRIEKIERYSYYPYNQEPVCRNLTIEELREKNEDYGGSDGNFKC